MASQTADRIRIAEIRFASDQRPMRLSLVLGLVYFASELLTITRRSRSPTGTKQDQSTLLVMWIVIMISIAAGVFVAGNWRAGALPDGRVSEVAGVVLFAIGLVLRWWAIITLGRFFTVDAVVDPPSFCSRGTTA